MIDRERLEHIVSEAGRLAMAKWPGAGFALRSWEKTPGSPVCEADLEIDAFLHRELGALLPAAGWLSEETADSAGRLDKDLIWLVDPIDGTRDFIRGRTGWAVSVALISNSKPLIGALAAQPVVRPHAVLQQQHRRAGRELMHEGCQRRARGTGLGGHQQAFHAAGGGRRHLREGV